MRLLPCRSKSNVSDVLPDGTVSSMPWRKTGVKYSQNEVYLDIVEEVDAILGVNGQVCVFVCVCFDFSDNASQYTASLRVS